MSNEELIDLAIRAREKAYVPYSNFKVGAILISENESFYEGANMECSSYGMSVCAERVALLKALYAGERKFKKLVVVAGKEENLEYTTPCGACRQFLADFGVDIEVICGYYKDGKIQYKSFSLRELLPENFIL